MQAHTVALRLRRWLRCVVARNPLVRGSDRREARALLVAVLLSLAAAPVAWTAGDTVYVARVETFETQRLANHQIASTAAEDSSPANAGYSKYHLTTVRWKVDTQEHTEVLETPYTVKAGDTLPIWVDEAGNHVPAPLSNQEATTEAVIAGFVLWLIVAGAGVMGWVLLRTRLDRSRYAEWASAIEDLTDNGGRDLPRAIPE